MREATESVAGSAYGPVIIGKTLDVRIKKLQEQFKKVINLIYFLLENGALVTHGDKDGLTPLHLLIQKYDVNLQTTERGYQRILELFVQSGADANAKTKSAGVTPLHEAAAIGDRVAIDFLLKNKARINDTTNKAKHTPLHLAAARGLTKTTALLIKSGANTNAVDKDGLTPLGLCKQVHLDDRQIVKFTDKQAEREFDEKYINTQRAFLTTPYLNNGSLSELARQRQNLHGTNPVQASPLSKPLPIEFSNKM